MNINAIDTDRRLVCTSDGREFPITQFWGDMGLECDPSKAIAVVFEADGQEYSLDLSHFVEVPSNYPKGH